MNSIKYPQKKKKIKQEFETSTSISKKFSAHLQKKKKKISAQTLCFILNKYKKNLDGP